MSTSYETPDNRNSARACSNKSLSAGIVEKFRSGEKVEIDALGPAEMKQLVLELLTSQVDLELLKEKQQRTLTDLTTTLDEYSELYESAPVGYCTVSREGRILKANRTAAAFFGMAAAEVINNLITSFIHKDDQDVYSQHNQILLETGTPQTFELRMIKKDGGVFSGRFNIGISQDSSNTPVFLVVLSEVPEHRRAGEYPARNGDHFRKLFEQHSAVQLVLDEENGHIIDANQAAEKFYGWPIEVLKTMTIQQINTLSPDAVKEAMRKVADSEASKLEFCHRRSDGSIRNVEIFSNRVEMSGRSVLYSIIHDITDRKRGEEALRRSEDLLRKANIQVENDKRLLEAVLEALPTGIAITDLTGDIIHVNKVYETICGGSRPKTLSIKDYSRHRAWWADTGKIVAPEELASTIAVREKRTTMGQIMRIQQVDGTEIFVMNSAAPAYDAEGNVVGSVVAIQDVSELKKMEKALAERELQLKLFIEHAPVALAMFDRNMRFLSVSRRWKNDYGMADRSLYGLSLYEVHAISERWREAHRRALAGVVQAEEEYRYQLPDGSIHWIRWEIHPWYCVSGEIGGVVIFSEDITSRKQVEEQRKNLNIELERRVEQRTRQLQETQSHFLHAEKLSAIGKLSASIAHEFNNPLQGIMTILKGLKRRAILEEEDRDLLEVAIDESERMKKLIRILQDFNRPSSSKKILMDLHASIDSILLLCRNDFNRKRVVTVLDYAEGLPRICAVPDQIKQVFLNLLNNAADACAGTGGVIKITTRYDGKNVAIKIKDSGMGIKAENIDLIFQPFFTTKSRQEKGTGLGLSVCQGIVQDHKGKILVESRPGEGSTFTVLLPADEDYYSS